MGRGFLRLSGLALAFLILVPFPSPARDIPDGPDNHVPAITAAIADVSKERLFTTIYDLTNFSTRYAYSPNALLAAQYLYDEFAAVPGLQVSFQDFTFGGTLMRNVVAVLPGLDPQSTTTYIVGGHYDSTSPTPMTNAPGGDDDGSGTAGTVELARVLGRYRFNATLMFIAFTAEELGLVGSDLFASCCAIEAKDVGLYINLDMIGWDPGNFRGVSVLHDVPSTWAADQFMSVVADYSIGINLTKGIGMANSDHASFWAAGYNSIFLTEFDFNSLNWHQTSDLATSLNMNLVVNTTQGAAAMLATLAGIRELGPGLLQFDRPMYGTTVPAGLSLYDVDLNTDSMAAETAPANVASPFEPAGEGVLLVETGNDTGVFTGVLPLGLAPGVPGELQVAAGDLITASYADASPAGTRTAQAVIDGTPPTIPNVAAVPDVDRAWILFESSEPTEGTVSYGATVSLGTDVAGSGRANRHRVELRGLNPDTTYYFDVRSEDEAGQTVLADNGGAHFAFHTLTGVATVPLLGHVGYAQSRHNNGNPPGTFFSANRFLAGHSAATGRIYRGGVQFDFSASMVPVGATVTRAWTDLFEDGFVYPGPGQWRVEYLNSSVDAGFTGLTYDGLANTTVDFQILPTLVNADMRPREWRSMDVSAADFANVHYRVNTGALSLRIDGPTSGIGSLYQWDSGYPLCPGLAPRLPRFTLTYSPTGDTLGPEVTFADGAPNPTMTAPRTWITANVSDAATGGTEIANAEFFLGADPGVGLGTPMAAADGAFDEVNEDAAYDLDLSSVPLGIYTAGVRARDRANNWGTAQTFLLYVGVWDLSLPNVTVSDAPDPAPLNGFVTLTANVTDDIGVGGVWLNVTQPGGATAFNISMPKPGVDWVHTASYSIVGTWLYVVWATDTTGRWNLDWGTFTVLDVTPPSIGPVAAMPNPGEYVERINVTATIIDDSAVWGARINVSMPDGSFLLNYTMLRNGDEFSHEWDYGLPLGTYTFVIWASDIYGLLSSATGSFVVRDSTPPLVVNATAVPDPVEVYTVVNISAEVSDLLLDNLTLRIIRPGGAYYDVLMGYNGSTARYYYLDWYGVIGSYSYVVTARDTSNNSASAFGTFLVQDTAPPLVFAYADPAWVLNPGQVNITAQAFDAYLLGTVTATITAPDLSVSGPFAMTYDPLQDLYVFPVATSLLGAYGFNVTVTDSSGNAAWSTGTFDAIDGVPPVIADLWAQPPVVEFGSDTRIGANATDAVGIVSVRFQVFDAAGTPLGNYTATFNASSGFWEYGRSYSPGDYTVRVWAADAAGNLAAMVTYFSVIPGQAPTAVAGDDQAVNQGTSVLFDGSLSSDDVGIVRWEWILSGPPGNLTFTTPSFDYRLTVPGEYTVTLTVWDSMGRTGTDQALLSVTPVASGHNDPVDLWPWLLLLLIIAMILAAIAIYVVVKRKKEREEEPPADQVHAPPGGSTPPPPPDEIPPPPD